MNKLTADHTIDSIYLEAEGLLSPINQPMADVEAEPEQTVKGLGWLKRLTERNYEAWRRYGGCAYGL
jgi:hypothetical protein